MQLEIIFEDNEIIVCKKPVGVLSQSDDDNRESMCSLIKTHIENQGKKPYVGVIHRLDMGVGGVMVYAKTSNAAAKLSSQVANKELFKKQYIAVVHGCPCDKKAVLEDLLFKDSRLGKSFVVDRQRKGVKKASLEYEVIASDDQKQQALLLITLHTGRTHQIRVQFSSRAMPLCGDKKYGARDSYHSIALWSYGISFRHPADDRLMSFFALPCEHEVFDEFDLAKLSFEKRCFEK